MGRMQGYEGRLGYSPKVALVACPFCREMFEEAEATQCPVCGVALAKLEKLPPSDDALSEDGIPVEPENERVPLLYLGRNRGVLVGLAVAGIALFFLPWVARSIVGLGDPPDVLTGLAVARQFGWPFAALVGWFVLLPTVISRRTIFHMRTARVAAALMAAIPGVTAAVLLARTTPTKGAHLLTYAVTPQWGLMATLFASLAAFLVALRFGGRIEDIKVSRGSSVGHTVH
jgi:hypothetical protein